MTIRSLLLSLALLSGAEAVSAAPKDPKTRPTPTTFKIDVHRMIPMAYRSHSLDPGYSVEVRNDSLICYLPYVGQNYTANPVGGVQLDFAVPIHSREQREGRKNSQVIRFRCADGAAAYEFLITLWPNGRANVDVMPVTAQRISYDGKVVTE